MSPALPLHRSPSSPGRARTLRWAAVVVVSLLVHLTVIDALPRLDWRAVEPAADDEPLRARLVPAVAADPSPQPASRAAAPAPAARQTPAHRTSVPPPFVPESMDGPAPVVVMPETSAAPAPVTAPVPASASLTAPAPAPAPTLAPVTAPTPAPVAAPDPVAPVAAVAAAIAPPASARLDYQVLSQNIRESNPIYGVGTIAWSAGDGAYAIDLHADAKLAFFSIGVLASHSEGTLGAQGLAPDRYTESPRRRGTLSVNFNRDTRQSVTFSASPAAVPLATGTQDRLSILFQIGGLLLGDASQGAAGARFDVPVAGVRGDVDLWTFQSFGKEPVVTPDGEVPSTHLRRVPRPESNDRTIDLWVADAGGYPARVVYTERDGSTITMTLEKVGAAR